MESIPLQNPFPGAVSYLLATTDSTQKDARRLAEAASLGGDPPAPGSGFPVGSVVAAEAQTAGRGRIPERKWESEAGKNLLFTVFLGPGRPPCPASHCGSAPRCAAPSPSTPKAPAPASTALPGSNGRTT